MTVAAILFTSALIFETYWILSPTKTSRPAPKNGVGS